MDQPSAMCPTCGNAVLLRRSMADDADPGGLILTCSKCHQQFDWPPGIGVDKWWDEPAYKPASGTFSERGAFIFAKLAQHDAAKLKDVMVDLYRDEEKDPQDIGKFEWQTILAYMGASDQEIKDVQLRMGRPWR